MQLTPTSMLRTLALAGLVASSLVSTGFAQCPSDDATTTNNTCVNAAPGTIGVVGGLAVQRTSPDYWYYTVGPYERLTIEVPFVHNSLFGNINLRLYRSCANQVDNSFTTNDLETVTYVNDTSNTVRATLLVVLHGTAPTGCMDYYITATKSPLPIPACVSTPDDALEDNDSCATSVPLSSNPNAGLFVSKTDEDYFLMPTVAPGQILTVTATHGGPAGANGTLEMRGIDASNCSTELWAGQSTPGQLEMIINNTTSNPFDVVVRMFIPSSSMEDCGLYDLEYSFSTDPCTLIPDDSEEDNDTCGAGSPPSANPLTGLVARRMDNDFYSYNVAPGERLDIFVTYDQDVANIDADLLFANCDGAYDLAWYSSGGLSHLTTTNLGATPYTAKLNVYLDSPGPLGALCNTYDLASTVTVLPSGNIGSFCFGDGSGTPCPCGNNSPVGHPGGCANSNPNGQGAVLSLRVPSNGSSPWVFDLEQARPLAFTILVSGNNRLPQAGGCVGCGVPFSDGLRCVGGLFRRHGANQTDSSGSLLGFWNNQLGLASGFNVGQTRHFASYYRDDLSSGCMTGLNSSNGVTVTMLP